VPVDAFRELVNRVFRGFLDEPHPWTPRPRLDRLPFSLHLVVGGGALELFTPGPLDVLRFFQRHHASVHHELEYVLCRPEGAPPDAMQAYGVFRLRDAERLPLHDVKHVERVLRQAYGTLVHLPPARSLLVRPDSADPDDGDPPAGLNRIQPPPEPHRAGRMTAAEVVDIVRRELPGPEVISWIEAAFRQPPKEGNVEHRYYLDASANLYVVRQHWREGKALYRAEVSDAALRKTR
jgi:hypothetical protein